MKKLTPDLIIDSLGIVITQGVIGKNIFWTDCLFVCDPHEAIKTLKAAGSKQLLNLILNKNTNQK